ncbi:hypothetical protein RhiirA4_394079 [Rhizophagus irregularis]|uniref:DNA polymerase delta subunit 3 n=1 Tax=Rhizophagus irregularis TaxID=588596 RepID=A0A2I1G022_9GLOM|nr:hypothetical protein RhiirA4_394079 [Rhizophagus irregularis]
MTATEQLVIVEQLVLQERKIVTYGWLSKYLNIHANKAKQLLYEFISEYKPSKENNVHAIYCICGLTADNKQHTVTLVTQEKLEAARKGFTRLTSLHVYSVQPVCPTEAELIKAGREPIDKVANEPVLNTNKDATTVTSTLVSQSIDVKESPKPEKVDEKKLAKSKSTSSEKSTPITVAIKNMVSQASDKTSDIDSVSNKTAPQDGSEASNKKEKKRKSIEVESNHSEDFGGSKEEQTNKKSKKQTTAKQKDDKTSDITSLLNKAASHKELKASNKKSKKRKSDEAIDFEISEEGKAANKQKNDKESLQSDDNSQNKVTTKDKVVKKRKSYKVADDLNQQEVEASKIVERKNGIASLLNRVDKTEQQLEISDKLDNLDINNDKKDQSQGKLSVALVQNTPLTAQQKKRGRRQILKSRSYVNERGYTVHENYHEWESFSEDELVSEKKPQKVIKAEEPNITAKRGKKKKGDNGSQKSLLNFFGRK